MNGCHVSPPALGLYERLSCVSADTGIGMIGCYKYPAPQTPNPKTATNPPQDKKTGCRFAPGRSKGSIIYYFLVSSIASSSSREN